MKKKIVTNYLFNASYQLLALIVPLITTPYISRILKAEGVGTYSYTYSIVSYFVLASVLGTAIFGNREIGIFQENPEERTSTFVDVFILRLMTSSCALIIYYLYVFYITEDKIIASIQGIYIIGVIFDISWFFQGLEEFKKIAVRNYIFKVVNVIYIFTFIKVSTDLWKYILGLAFFTLVGNLSIWIYLPKYVVKLTNYQAKPLKNIRTVLQLFIPAMAVQVYAIVDKTMIGIFTGTTIENGYYEQSEKIIKMCLMLITSLSTIMLPRISKAFSEGNNELAIGYINKSYKFVWFLGTPLMFGTIGTAHNLVPVFFGEGFEKVQILLPIMSALFIFMGFNHTTGNQFFITSGRQEMYTKIVLIGGFINIAFNLLLVPKYFSIGGAIATVFGEIAITFISFTFIYRNRLFSIAEIIKMSVKYITAGIIMLIYIIVFTLLTENSVVYLFLEIVTGGFMYFTVLLILNESITVQGVIILKNTMKKIFKV